MLLIVSESAAKARETPYVSGTATASGLSSISRSSGLPEAGAPIASASD